MAFGNFAPNPTHMGSNPEAGPWQGENEKGEAGSVQDAVRLRSHRDSHGAVLALLLSLPLTQQQQQQQPPRERGGAWWDAVCGSRGGFFLRLGPNLP